MRITRTTNPNGTYRYDVDGQVFTKASKVLYTHATSYAVNQSTPVLFHKTENAANRAKGYPTSGWVKTATIVIEDGDAPAVDENDTRCQTCIAHPGWAHANEAQRREPQDICKDCLGSGLESVAKNRRAPAAGVELWENYQGETFGYDAEGDRVIEISARVRPDAWNGHTASNVRSWAVIRDGVAASGTADGLRAAKKAATAALAQVATQSPAEPREAPRKGTVVRVNATYRGVAFKGRQGTVQGVNQGDDGNQYVTVDFGTATWIYLVTELDEVGTARPCGWCGTALTANQGKFCSRSCTVRQQNRNRARRR